MTNRRFRLGRTIHRSVLMVTTATAFAASFASAQDELPPALKSELSKIEKKLDDLERDLRLRDRESVSQSLKEVRQSFDEFSLNAELTEGDPIQKRLNERMKKIESAIGAIEKERADKAMADAAETKAAMKKSSTGESAIEIPIDMKNVSFKKDVAPIIAISCVRCHNKTNKSGDFDASSFASFAAQLTPGKPDDSHLLKLVTGKAEPRMPRGGQAAFPRRWVEIWSAWIEQGAKFDGPSKDAAITSYMIDLDSQRREVFAKMPAGELEKMHAARSNRHVEIVNPKKPVTTLTTEHFHVRTTLSKDDAEYVGAVAEAVVEDLARRFKDALPKEPFKGKYGLYVFADRYDFLAFARLVDKYEPEDDETGYVRIGIEHQYVATNVGEGRGELEFIVAQHVAASVLGQLGDRKLVPWAVYGYSRAAAHPFAPKSTDLRDDLARAAESVGAGKNLNGLLGEQYPWVDLGPMSTSLFEVGLKGDRKKVDDFMRRLSRSGDVRGSISAAFGGAVDGLNRAWLDQLSRAKPRRK